MPLERTTVCASDCTPPRTLSSRYRMIVELGKKSVVRVFVEFLEDRETASLVAAYAFNEGSGTTVADASGTGNNGTILNATWWAAEQTREGVV